MAKTHQRLRWTATQLDEGEWKVESLHYYTENILYSTLENIYTAFLLFFFQIFKVYSS